MYVYMFAVRFSQDHKEFVRKSKDSLITRSAKELSLLQFHEVEPYLQSNPFIVSGYRASLSTKMCIERSVPPHPARSRTYRLPKRFPPPRSPAILVRRFWAPSRYSPQATTSIVDKPEAGFPHPETRRRTAVSRSTTR